MDFIELAQECAPQVEIGMFAAIAHLASDFKPFAITINGDYPLADQPQTKAEGIETAAALAADGMNISIGLTGLNFEDLPRLGISVSDAFDPCINLKTSGRLLTEYHAAATQAGSPHPAVEMLRAFFGRGDIESGKNAGYAEQVLEAASQLDSIVSTITVGSPSQDSPEAELSVPSPEEAPATNPDSRPNVSAAKGPSWDVFQSDRSSSVLVFPNH